MSTGTHQNTRGIGMSLEATLPLFSDTTRAIPSLDNYVTRSAVEKSAFRHMLSCRQLVPTDLTQAYLKFFFITKADGTKPRPLVDGREAETRHIYCPRYAYPLSVPDAARKLIPYKWYCATDLSAAYQQIQVPPSPYLTVRINGRIYEYRSPPQGLPSSPAVCISVFHRVFEACGFTSYYVDNAAIGRNTADETRAAMMTAMNQLSTTFKINVEETYLEPQRTIEWLGLVISHRTLTLPPSKHAKLLRILESGDSQKISGYYSYLSDIFGSGTSRRFHNIQVFADGAKGQYHAAVAICTLCDGVVEMTRRRGKQDSQVVAELKAVLLADALYQKYISTNIYTDARYLVEAQRSGIRRKTMITCTVSQIGPLEYIEGINNRADPYTRDQATEVITKRCTCTTGTSEEL